MRASVLSFIIRVWLHLRRVKEGSPRFHNRTKITEELFHATKLQMGNLVPSPEGHRQARHTFRFGYLTCRKDGLPGI